MRRLAPLAALLALGIAGCGSDDSQPASGREAIDIAQFKYHPARLEVAAGARVTFTNRDRASHTATAPRGLDTGILRRGQARTLRLTRPGTYAYLCELHPFMKGTIVVRGEEGAS